MKKEKSLNYLNFIKKYAKQERLKKEIKYIDKEEEENDLPSAEELLQNYNNELKSSSLKNSKYRDTIAKWGKSKKNVFNLNINDQYNQPKQENWGFILNRNPNESYYNQNSYRNKSQYVDYSKPQPIPNNEDWHTSVRKSVDTMKYLFDAGVPQSIVSVTRSLQTPSLLGLGADYLRYSIDQQHKAGTLKTVDELASMAYSGTAKAVGFGVEKFKDYQDYSSESGKMKRFIEEEKKRIELQAEYDSLKNKSTQANAGQDIGLKTGFWGMKK